MSSRMKPQGYEECSRCKMMTKAAVCRCGMKMRDEVAREAAPAEKPAKAAGGPNKTEARYRAEVLSRRLDLVAVAYEGLTFRMVNGHRYTPDWVARSADGQVWCFEVKGAYRFGSHQRARLAFDQAATEWPCFRWVWAERQKDGSWKHTAPRATPGQVDADGTGTGQEQGSATEGVKGRFRGATGHPAVSRYFQASEGGTPPNEKSD